jgi:hypothetical protein
MSEEDNTYISDGDEDCENLITTMNEDKNPNEEIP